MEYVLAFSGILSWKSPNCLKIPLQRSPFMVWEATLWWLIYQPWMQGSTEHLILLPCFACHLCVSWSFISFVFIIPEWMLQVSKLQNALEFVRDVWLSSRTATFLQRHVNLEGDMEDMEVFVSLRINSYLIGYQVLGPLFWGDKRHVAATKWISLPSKVMEVKLGAGALTQSDYIPPHPTPLPNLPLLSQKLKTHLHIQHKNQTTHSHRPSLKHIISQKALESHHLKHRLGRKEMVWTYTLIKYQK